MHFGHIRVSDLLLVNHKGEVVQGSRPVNTAALAIHSQIHHARPDVIAAAHAHSLYGKTWATLGRLLDPLTQVKIDPPTAQLTYSQIGSPYMGWFSFQSLYEMMVNQEPDLLD